MFCGESLIVGPVKLGTQQDLYLRALIDFRVFWRRVSQGQSRRQTSSDIPTTLRPDRGHRDDGKSCCACWVNELE